MAPTAGTPGALAEHSRARGLHITPRTCLTRWEGDRVDLDLAVEVLCQRHRWGDPKDDRQQPQAGSEEDDPS